MLFRSSCASMQMELRTQNRLRVPGLRARKVRALAEIAAVAGKGEIVMIVGPAVLSGDDVLDVVG